MVSVLTSGRAGATFYGQRVGQASFGVTVRLQAQSPWIGRTTLKTAVDGQVPGNGGDVGLGIQNALSHGSASLHKFLDQLSALRSKKLAEALRKKELESRKEKKEKT